MSAEKDIADAAPPRPIRRAPPSAAPAPARRKQTRAEYFDQADLDTWWADISGAGKKRSKR